jgi:hypothetical protein
MQLGERLVLIKELAGLRRGAERGMVRRMTTIAVRSVMQFGV